MTLSIYWFEMNKERITVEGIEKETRMFSCILDFGVCDQNRIYATLLNPYVRFDPLETGTDLSRV